MNDVTSTPLLSVRQLTKCYADVAVLRELDFDLCGGEIHALLGANGAGKSTLCKIISGLTDATSGQMQINGRLYQPSDKHAAESASVQMVQQELNLIPTLNVAENLMLNRMPNRLGFVNHRALHDQARRALDRLQLHAIETPMLVEQLGVGRRQMIEIAAALDRQCRILILDEPTAALSASETELLFDQLFQLRDQGVGLIYISHRLDEVKRIADRVTVLRDGRHVCTVPTASITTEQMVQRMSGMESESESVADPSESASAGSAQATASIRASSGTVADSTVADSTAEQMLVVKGLCSGMVQDISLRVGQGETLGITGLVGSGRTELLRAIFGADVASAGSVSVAGTPPTLYRHPAHAVADGLAMVTEDRKSNGLMLPQSVRCNTTLSAMAKRFSNLGLIKQRSECSVSQLLCEQMETRCTSIEQSVQTLSGGNQQKVVIAKWLVRDADVFLFDEPTRGIDVAARRRIYRLFDELTAAGKALVIVSSDLEELFDTCDRIAVLSAGRLIETRDRALWTEDQILQASFSGHRSPSINNTVTS